MPPSESDSFLFNVVVIFVAIAATEAASAVVVGVRSALPEAVGVSGAAVSIVILWFLRAHVLKI